MIRSILILTVLAALVPTVMSSVSASSESEIALFSTASVDTDSLSITGNGDSAKMELKATNDNGKSNRVSGFLLTADNVLSTDVGDKVTVIDNVDFTKAVTTDAWDNQKAIGITSNGAIDLAGYTQGIYTLDVVVDDDRAYEAIIAIGDQTNQIVDKEITRVNSDYTLKFIIDYDCGKGYHYENGKCIPNDPTPVPSPVPCPESDPNCIEPPITPPITPEPEYPVDPCTTDLTSPDCQNLEEPVVLPLVGENTVEIPNEPVEDEFLEEEETEEAEQEQNEGFTGEEEEVEEESSEEEESGESEGEDSGEESEGESEEDSAFGN